MEWSSLIGSEPVNLSGFLPSLFNIQKRPSRHRKLRTPDFIRSGYCCGLVLLQNACGLTLRLLTSYIYGAPSKGRNANVVYIWTYVWQR